MSKEFIEKLAQRERELEDMRERLAACQSELDAERAAVNLARAAHAKNESRLRELLSMSYDYGEILRRLAARFEPPIRYESPPHYYAADMIDKGFERLSTETRIKLLRQLATIAQNLGNDCAQLNPWQQGFAAAAQRLASTYADMLGNEPGGLVPIKLSLCCPKCSFPHYDEGEWATKEHRTHLCASCQKEWRPYPFPTFGVRGFTLFPDF